MSSTPSPLRHHHKLQQDLLGGGVLLGQQHANIAIGHGDRARSISGQQPPRDALHSSRDRARAELVTRG